MKKEEKNNQRWNDLYDELGQYEKSFCDYLSSVGANALYVADVTCVNNGDISPEKRKMEIVRRKVEQYIQLGGETPCIRDLDKIDEYIDKVKYLNSKKCLYRQLEFQFDDLQQTKNQIEVQEKYLHEGINCLLHAKGNILKDILFEKYEDMVNERVEQPKLIQVLTPDLAEKFLAENDTDDIDLLAINISVEEKRIVIYDWAKWFPIYYVCDDKQTITKTLIIVPTKVPLERIQSAKMAL